MRTPEIRSRGRSSGTPREQIDELVRGRFECGASRVALLGGLASPMQPWLAPDVQRRLVPVEGDAVDGALHLARRAVMKG